MIDVQITEEQNAILQAAKPSGNIMKNAASPVAVKPQPLK